MRKKITGIMAAVLVLGTAMTAQASEVGVITAMSEKVYLENREDATVLENILQGTSVEVILTVTDEAGGAWYYVRTSAGLEGYMPADSVSIVQVQQQEEEVSDTQQPEAAQQVIQDDTAQETEQEAQDELVLTATDNVNIRQLPDVSSAQIGNITRGTQVEFSAAYTNEAGEVWYAVSYQGIDGYVIGTAVDIGEITVEAQPWSQEAQETPETEQTTEQTETQTASETSVQTQSETEPETPQSEETQQSEEQTESAAEVQTSQRSHHIETFEVMMAAAIVFCAAAIVFLIGKIRNLLHKK